MATYVNDLRLKEIATGDESGTWGTSTNTNLELIAEAFSFGTEAITTNADTHTTTIADGSTDPGRSIFLKYTGTLDSACTITIGPNTVSKLWLIENATSGSQNIIISQGSGANITIANGQTKAIYSDGAGSGAAMVDAFQDLSIPDLFIDDDLTFTSDSAVITFGADGDTTLTHTDGSGLTLNSTNKIMFNDASQFIQGSSATVLSLGATDEIDLTATAIDVNGTMDVSGTLGVTGIVTLADDLIIGDGKTIGSASDVDAMTIASNGQVTFTQTLIGTALDISGDIDVDGTTNLDVVDIDGAVDMASTLAVAGVVTANAGVVVDNITIDGQEIDVSSGDLTLDVAGDIILDFDGGDLKFVDGGTEIGLITSDSSNFGLFSRVSDKDIIFYGNDGGSTITALTLDMSDAGTATFNSHVRLGDNKTASFGAGFDIEITSDGTNGTIGAPNGTLTLDVAGDIILDADTGVWRFKDAGTTLYQIAVDGASVVLYTGVSDADMVFKGNDGGSTVTALTLDMSAAGAAFFNDDIYIPDQIIHTGDTDTYMQFHGGDSWRVVTAGSERFHIEGASVVFNSDGHDADFRVESDANTHALFVDAGNNSLGIFNSADTDMATVALGLTGVAISGDTDGATIGKTGIASLYNLNNHSTTDATIMLLGGGSAGALSGQISSGFGFARHSGASWGTQIKMYVHPDDTVDVDELHEAARVGPNEFVINETSNDYDFRVESNSFTNMLVVNAGLDCVAVGSSGTSARFTTAQSSATPITGYFHNTASTITNTSGSILYLQTSGDSAIQDGYKMVTFADSDTVLGTISTAASSTNVAYNTSSDERLKESIVDMEPQLDKVLAAKPRQFDWKKNGLTSQGFIAQELHEVFPEAVTVGGEDPTESPWSVDYGRITPFLMKAIQEQQEQIEELKAEIAKLKGE